MNKLPKLLCALREDFKNVDYSEWERQNQTKPKPFLGGLAHSDRKVVKSSHGPYRERDRETNESSNDNKQSEKSGSSQGNTNEDSSAASSALSRRIKTFKGEQDSACVNDNSKALKLLIKLQRRSIKDLEKHCEVLKEMNQQVARDIKDTDRCSVSSARELLIHHVKLGSSIAAYSQWSNWQIKQAKAELKDTVNEAKNRLSGLQVQLQAVNANLVNAQTELHTLKTYKDEEYPVNVLQITKVKGDLDKLKEAQQHEREDMKLLCQTEMTRLEKQLQQKQQEMLSAIAKKNVSYIPPTVKIMASHNCTMKKETEMHKKEIMHLEEENRRLLKSIQELQWSRPNIIREVFQSVYPVQLTENSLFM